MTDNTNSIYTNMKGKKCPLRDNLTCQEGYCSECEIPLSNNKGEKKMTRVIRFSGTPKQMIAFTRELARDFGRLTLLEVIKGSKCKFLPIMRR